MSVRDGIDEWVKVERRQIRVLCLYEDHRGMVVPREMDIEWQAVVEIGKGDSVLCSDRLTDNDFVDVIEFVPIFLSHPQLFLHEGFEFRSPGDGEVEGFGCEERLEVKEVEVVVID